MVYLPGNFRGDALADVLSGKVNPSGRLPFTYPRWPQGLLTYWHKYSEEVNFNPKDPRASDWAPQWEFGFGLSYTLFQYQNLILSSSGILRAGATMNVSVDVVNTGTKVGKDVVMLFTSDLVASLAPDVKRLRKFQKIELQPGRSQRVTFQLRPEDLSFVNMVNKRVTEPGKFRVTVGTLSAEFKFQL
jgi:beta-glucosidase